MEILDRQGWLLLDSVYDSAQLSELCSLADKLAPLENEAVRGREGAVYAARNVLELVPELLHHWQTPQLIDLLYQVLGEEAGLVRALYFDKPPEQTWGLPWHKDLLIAIDSNSTELPTGYSRPRPRVGVLHTEPPVCVLESMLTLRIHLDAMTETNGPLEVLNGSHKTGKKLDLSGFQPTCITSGAGAVFVMRPLLVHASGRSAVSTREHRRVLHLEFSGMKQLPAGVQWHTFVPINWSKVS